MLHMNSDFRQRPRPMLVNPNMKPLINIFRYCLFHLYILSIRIHARLEGSLVRKPRPRALEFLEA